MLGPYPPPHGGVETHLVSLQRYLRKQQIPCQIINLTRHRKTPADGVYYPRGAFGVLWLLLRLRYDLLHLHVGGDFQPRQALLGLLCVALPWARTIFTFHSGGYPSTIERASAWRKGLSAFVFRRFHRLIGVNQQLVDFFHEIGIPRQRIHLVCPAAVSPEEVKQATSADFRSLAGDPVHAFFNAHQPTLLTVSGLEPEYDIPLQIEALEQVRRSRPRAGLIVLGSGTLQKTLEDLIATKPYAEHILLAGDLSHAATLRAIAEAEIFLRTTLYDGDSISLREALLFGTPVIASDNGMRPPGVRLIPAADRVALANAIDEALASSASRRAAPPAGDEDNVQQVLAIYREMVS